MGSYTSTAYVYHGPKDVRTETINFDCGPRELVVKIHAAGRCGTDRTIYRQGHAKVNAYAPVVLGHEFVAEIVEIGSEVASLTEGIGYLDGQEVPADKRVFELGERVMVQSRVGKYRNGLILQEEPITILSFYINAGFSQYMLVTEELIRSGSVLRIPEGIDDNEVILLEPTACCMESIFHTPHAVGVDEDGRHIFKAGIQPGGHTCIIGSGTVSLIYGLLAKVEGADKVIILCRSEEKAKRIREIMGEGFDAYAMPRLDGMPLEEKLEHEKGIATDLEKMTEGRLFDDVVAACADPDAQRLMFQLYNKSGYAVGACFGGTHKVVEQADVDQSHYRVATTMGTSGTSTRTMEIAIDWLAAGKLDLKRFVAPEHFTFNTPPDEFFTTEAGGLKPILYPWE